MNGIVIIRSREESEDLLVRDARIPVGTKDVVELREVEMLQRMGLSLNDARRVAMDNYLLSRGGRFYYDR